MDQYFVVKLLGRGTEGQVLQCQTKKTGEIVAIKRVEWDSLERANESLNEAWRLLNLPKYSPYLVQYKRVFLHKYPTAETHFVCCVMEFCPGGDLAQVIKRAWSNKKNGPAMKEKDVLLYLLQICEGLNFLHENGIIHRDLKPSNILCATENHKVLKIGDFGTAREVSKSSLCKTMVGTPNYMSWEVLNDQAYDEKVDLYSLGVIFLEMLTGKSVMLSTELKKDPQLFEHYKDLIVTQFGYSEALFELMKSLLSFQPQNRPTARQCLKMIRQLLASKNEIDSINSKKLPSLKLFHFDTDLQTKLKVLSFLEISDLYCLMRTSRLYYQLTNYDSLWLQLCHKLLGKPLASSFQPQKHMSWKQYVYNYMFYEHQPLDRRQKLNYGKQHVHEILPNQLEEASQVLAMSYQYNPTFYYIITGKKLALPNTTVNSTVAAAAAAALPITVLGEHDNHNTSSSAAPSSPQLPSPPPSSETNTTFHTSSSSQIHSPTGSETPTSPSSSTFESSSQQQHLKEEVLSTSSPSNTIIPNSNNSIVPSTSAANSSVPPRKVPKLTPSQFACLQLIMLEVLKHSIKYGRVFVLTEHDRYNNAQIQCVNIVQPPYNSKLVEFHKTLSTKNRHLLFKLGLKTFMRLGQGLQQDETELLRYYKMNKAKNQSKNKTSKSAASPVEPNWVVYMLGVRPEYQGNGMGGLVLAPLLKMIDENKLSCLLLTRDVRNLSFFKRYGFNVVNVNQEYTTINNGKKKKDSNPTTAAAPKKDSKELPSWILKRNASDADIFVHHN